MTSDRLCHRPRAPLIELLYSISTDKIGWAIYKVKIYFMRTWFMSSTIILNK